LLSSYSIMASDIDRGLLEVAANRSSASNH
jgi:hypothetical protein